MLSIQNCCFGVFIVNFEHIQHVIRASLFLTLNVSANTGTFQLFYKVQKQLVAKAIDCYLGSYSVTIIVGKRV